MRDILNYRGKVPISFPTQIGILIELDIKGKPIEISHYCRVNSLSICIEDKHFGVETREVNREREAYQSSRMPCNCNDPQLQPHLRRKPCQENGSVGEKILDDNGKHIGWKPTDISLAMINNYKPGANIPLRLRSATERTSQTRCTISDPDSTTA